MNTVIGAHLKSISKLEERIKDEKVIKEKINKDFETVTAKFAKLQDEFNAKHHTLEQLHKNYNKKLTDIKVFLLIILVTM